jgi:hypothetical protein
MGIRVLEIPYDREVEILIQKFSTLNVLGDYLKVNRAVDDEIKVMVKSNHVETMKKSLQFLYFYMFVCMLHNNLQCSAIV